MQIIFQIRLALTSPLQELLQAHVADPAERERLLANALGMIRPAQNAQFGDYQANFAMPLSKPLGMKSVEVAHEIVQRADLSALCSGVEVAGPGFINLTLSDHFLTQQAQSAFESSQQPTDRLGVSPPDAPRTYVVDYSSPNVAKPMHVGHIRTTVIGDALTKVLRFLGHHVITDNHIGDWGTQFGMIIYGYRHFLEPEAYRESPVKELSRLYRQVRSIMDVLDSQQAVPRLTEAIEQQEIQISDLKKQQAEVAESGDKKAIKSARQKTTAAENKLAELQQQMSDVQTKLERAAQDPELMQRVDQHRDIGSQVLQETSKLHAGDSENVQLWKKILPHCHDEMDRIYDRLNICFDYTLGESFYHDQLGPLVEKLKQQGLVTESEGAQCIFLEAFDTPMIIQKRDGAYLYATTDLATIEYRMQNWNPDGVLYVVDARQKEHFDKLFAVAQRMGYGDRNLFHVSFGTVMGPDKKPFKTRSGDTVGLEGFIDEAVQRAHQVLVELDEGRKEGPQFSDTQRQEIAEVVGVGALKFGDLSQNRTSDYVFDFQKLVALDGDTATYIQYGYARVNGIFDRVGITPEALRSQQPAIMITNPGERALILSLIRFEDALLEVLVDYRPNLLCSYLVELTREFFAFYNRKDCRVTDVDQEQQQSRLAMCDLVARTLKTGLSLLGIGVVPRM